VLEDEKKDHDAFETPAVQMTMLKDHERVSVRHELLIIIVDKVL